MEYLSLDQISKSYGEKVLFERIDLTISRSDKIAIIARNGSGKSTLLRIIGGLESPEGERAKVHLNKNITTAFLDQDPQMESQKTVREEFFDLNIPQFEAIKKYNQALISGKEDVISTAMTVMDDLKAWDMEARGKEILYRLQLRDLEQTVGTISGGQKKRLALAKIIMSQPDFLILDEPTNHLDIEMIEWLEQYLSTTNLTLLMVTHDRYFLERICNQIIELDRGKLYHYKGNYSDYLEKKALRSHQEQTAIAKSKKLYLKELSWINRQPKARGTKAKSRIYDFKKLEDEISSIKYEEVFEINVKPLRLGKKILEFYDISKAFGNKKIVQDFWYKFKKGERVGISGPNGSGKTTFVKMLLGLEKVDSGKRVQGETVHFGYYSQDGLAFDDERRVIDVIRDIAEYIPLEKGYKLTAAKLLENFMFPRDQQQVYVSQLSGGERKRLHLLAVLMSNPNFLILDEPTNDLDVLTLNVLEEYLMKFPGCLVIVSHDRFFMDKLVDHMFIFEENGRIKDFNGTYSEWKASASKSSGKNDKSSDGEKIEKTLTTDHTIRKLSYLEKKELQQIEDQIEQMEQRKRDIQSIFEQGNIGSDDIVRLSKELGEIKHELDVKESRWLELSEYL